MPASPLRIAGAGPAGIHAAADLARSDLAEGVAVDLFEPLPVPFGLSRYGVARDHPRLREAVTALERVLDRPQAELIAAATAPDEREEAS